MTQYVYEIKYQIANFATKVRKTTQSKVRKINL